MQQEYFYYGRLRLLCLTESLTTLIKTLMRINRFPTLLAVIGVYALALGAQAQNTVEKAPADAPLANAALVVVNPGVQDIFLLIGQSNMGGRATISELDKEVVENVYLFNGLDQWEKA